MKFANLSKVVGASALALSLSILPSTLPASAQTNTAPGGTGTTDQTTTTPNTTGTTDDAQRTQVDNQRYEDNDFDWGWLGLLGLLGLAGLAGRKRQEPTAYRDPNTTVSTTGYRE